MIYFMPQSHRIYAWAMRLSPLYRVLVTMLTIATLWLIWFYAIYYKNMQRINHYTHDIAMLRTQSSQLATVMQECATAQQAIEQAHAYIESHTHALTGNTIAQSRMIDLIKCTQESALSLTGCSLGKSIDKDWYTKHSIQINVIGSLLSIQQFFERIHKMEKMIQCSRMRIAHHSNQQETTLFHALIDTHIIALKDKKDKNPST